MRQWARPNQLDVVCKTKLPDPLRAQGLQSPRLARQLSCCLQEAPLRSRPAKRLQLNALGPKLRCCLQDGKASASGLVGFAGRDSVPQKKGFSPGTLSNSRDGWHAISVSCRGTRRDTRGPQRVSLGDSRSAAAADNLEGRKPFVAAETSRVGNSSDSSGTAVGPFGCCRI